MGRDPSRLLLEGHADCSHWDLQSIHVYTMNLCMCAFPFLVHVSPPLLGRLVGAALLAALLSGRDGPLQ